MDSYVLCGMQFGDEGKGTFVDYLAHEQNVDCVVKYNGGAQASHTVVTPSMITHRFSQLGSGMFLVNCHTYLTENMVINFDSLIKEMEVFSMKTGISILDLVERIHIHEDCYVVTPYHKLVNKLRELSKGANRRGTVGTGVSEVRYLLAEQKLLPYEPPLGLQVKDIFNKNSNNPVFSRLEALQNYVETFYRANCKTIWQNAPEEIKEPLQKEIEILLEPKAFLRIAELFLSQLKNAPQEVNFINCLYSSYERSFRRDFNKAIFEGSQGLLIDGKYGIKPNTTFLDTTNHFALDISDYKDNIIKVGIAKAFNTRHGLGVFPTESAGVGGKISDKNQSESFWNGSMRFGWFDALLLRYAQSINQVEELYLSSLDKLDSFETIYVCSEYHYNGIVDKGFYEIFDYYSLPDGYTVIRDIKKPSENLGKYLEKCIPRYIVVDGWQQDISNVSEKSLLPAECLAYISLLEKLIHIPITTISLGPTRENKIRM
ncbi:MAG: adenylosuccinate synthetase [Clostridia bacterium]|nr:adenylosuccinate synthetase [Clostridia bacterium]